jgi:hypothetical protein
MMNCEQFQNVMLDLARDAGDEGREETLDAATVKDALEHADTCRACDELLEEAEAISLALRELAVRHSSDQAPARVETALLRRLELRRALAMRRAWRLRLYFRFPCCGTAACLFPIPHRMRCRHRQRPRPRQILTGLPAIVSSPNRRPAGFQGLETTKKALAPSFRCPRHSIPRRWTMTRWCA